MIIPAGTILFLYALPVPATLDARAGAEVPRPLTGGDLFIHLQYGRCRLCHLSPTVPTQVSHWLGGSLL